MKTLIHILIIGMFAVEVSSPFFIGYLNKQEKQRKCYLEKKIDDVLATKKSEIQNQSKKSTNWKAVDFSENNYSDSKTFTVKE